MGLDLLPAFIREHYEVHEWKHACAILRHDFPSEWQDLCDLLTQFRLRKSWITVGGGRKSQVSDHIDRFLYERGWQEKQFLTQIKVDAATRDAPTHKVDCFKNRVAIEIEWNNKDPFFDRDLNNFRLLFELRAIYAGVIVTRSDDPDPVIRELGRYPSFGQATTHMGKLVPRLEGGGGGGCPVLAFGISRRLLTED